MKKTLFVIGFLLIVVAGNIFGLGPYQEFCPIVKKVSTHTSSPFF